MGLIAIPPLVQRFGIKIGELGTNTSRFPTSGGTNEPDTTGTGQGLEGGERFSKYSVQIAEISDIDVRRYSGKVSGLGTLSGGLPPLNLSSPGVHRYSSGLSEVSLLGTVGSGLRRRTLSGLDVTSDKELTDCGEPSGVGKLNKSL